MGYRVINQGHLVSSAIIGIIRVTMWAIGLLTYLLSAPCPPSDEPSTAAQPPRRQHGRT